MLSFFKSISSVVISYFQGKLQNENFPTLRTSGKKSIYNTSKNLAPVWL